MISGAPVVLIFILVMTLQVLIGVVAQRNAARRERDGLIMALPKCQHLIEQPPGSDGLRDWAVCGVVATHVDEYDRVRCDKHGSVELAYADALRRALAGAR